MKYSLLSLKIKKYRTNLKMTQEELAKKLNLSVGTIKTYEIGTRVPSSDIKKKLCNLFHIKLEELEGESEKEDLKEHLTSIINTYHLKREELQDIKEIFYTSWEHCSELYSKNDSINEEVLKCFEEKGSKYSAENIKVSSNLISTLNKDKDSKLLNISTELINATIHFIYDYFICKEYKKIIFKGTVLDYENYILFHLCFSNTNIVFQALKEIQVTSQVQKYCIPLLENVSDYMENKDLNNTNKFIELPISMKKENTNYIAIKIKDDEMSLKYEKNNIVIIRLQNEFSDSQDVFVSIENQAPIMRRVRKQDNNIILQPLNNSYFPQSFLNSDVKKGKVKILGVVVQIIMNNDI